jgi:hypothetical protein
LRDIDVERALTSVLLVLGSAVTTFAVVWLGLTLTRRARRGVPGVASFGWALLFLTSGRMPPPPPESQIEAELNTEKDRLIGRKKGQGG